MAEWIEHNDRTATDVLGCAIGLRKNLEWTHDRIMQRCRRYATRDRLINTMFGEPGYIGSELHALRLFPKLY